jgi:C_GCAxxG_C_C family probable redox protein
MARPRKEMVNDNSSKVDQCVRCFADGFNCSQALVSTYGPQFGLDTGQALRISSPFGAGMGRMSETCGAVTGAFMVIGLKAGRVKVDDKDAQERTYRLVNEFVGKFKERNGSILCRELIGYDLSKPEEMKHAREEGAFRTKCPKFVRDSAQILESLVL